MRLTFAAKAPSHVRFIVVEDSLGPAVTGVLRPVVLLPQQMVERYSQGELKMVVMHELEHIQRHDTTLLLLAQIVTIVHWCNPLVYWLRRQLQAQAEIAVDAATLRKLGAEKVSQYAELLFSIASVNRTPANLLSMARKSIIFRRRIELLAEFEHHTPLSKLIGVLAISGVALTGLSDATSQERPSKPSIEAAVAPAKDPTTESAHTSETNKPTDTPPTNKAPAVIEAQDTKPIEEQRREDKDTDKPVNSELRKVSGRVVDSQGNGVPNASLFCSGWTQGKRANRLATTDQNGDFNLLLPKKKGVFDSLFTWVNAEGFALRVVNFAAMNNTGDIRGVSIPLLPLAIKPTRVQVMAPNGTPMAGALVYPSSIGLPNGRFLADEPRGLITSIPQELLESLAVRTDKDGRATFDHFADGLWDGVACQIAEFGVQEYRRSPSSQELKLRLLPVGSIRGKIAAEDLTRFKNFRYSIETETILENGHEMRGVASGVINDKGEFYVPAIAAGSIHRFSIGSANESTQDVELICDNYRSQTVSANSTLELKLEAPKTIPVSGVVLTSDTRQPVSGAVISYSRHNSPHHRRCTTNEKGEFHVNVVPGRVYFQMITTGNDLEVSRRYSHAGGFPDQITEATNLEILLPVRKQVKGRLQDAAGRPIANQKIGRVTSHFQHLLGWATTDAEGHFQMYPREIDPDGYWAIIDKAESDKPEFTKVNQMSNTDDFFVLERPAASSQPAKPKYRYFIIPSK